MRYKPLMETKNVDKRDWLVVFVSGSAPNETTKEIARFLYNDRSSADKLCRHKNQIEELKGMEYYAVQRAKSLTTRT